MNTTPTTYTIRVDGHLDDHWSAWLGEHDLTRPRRRHHHRHRLGRRPNAAPWCTRPPARHRRRPHRAPHHRRPATICRSVLKHPLHTEHLTLRPATADHADATWTYRQLESVNQWVTGCPADLDGYRRLFSEPARLATTVIITISHDPAGLIIGDLMLRRAASSTTTPPGASWSAWACAANCTPFAAHCTDPADGWKRSDTQSSMKSGHRLSHRALRREDRPRPVAVVRHQAGQLVERCADVLEAGLINGGQARSTDFRVGS